MKFHYSRNFLNSPCPRPHTRQVGDSLVHYLLTGTPIELGALTWPSSLGIGRAYAHMKLLLSWFIFFSVLLSMLSQYSSRFKDVRIHVLLQNHGRKRLRAQRMCPHLSWNLSAAGMRQRYCSCCFISLEFDTSSDESSARVKPFP